MNEQQKEGLRERVERENAILDGLNSELAQIMERLEENKREYTVLQLRRHALSVNHPNLIDSKLSEIRKLQQEYEDRDLPRVKFLESPLKGEWVVDKVTPKRVYIRKAGSSTTLIFHPNGYYSRTSQSGAKIDYEETRKLSK
jgi:hypothetical protein